MRLLVLTACLMVWVCVQQSVATSDPCKDHVLLEHDGWRSATYQLKQNDNPRCDRYVLVNNNWYRFGSRNCNTIPRQTVPNFHCATVFPIWTKDRLPTGGDITNMTVCSTINSDCDWNKTIQVKRCMATNRRPYYVYKLYRPEYCDLSYCAGNTHHEDCNAAPVLPPAPVAMENGGVCDKRGSGECMEVRLTVTGVVHTGNLTCRVTPVQGFPPDQRIDRQLTSYVRAKYDANNTVTCNLRQPIRGAKADVPSHGSGGSMVALSQDGHTYGPELYMAVYDSKCQECSGAESIQPDCKIKSSVCLIEGVCYSNSEDNPGNSTNCDSECCTLCDSSTDQYGWTLKYPTPVPEFLMYDNDRYLYVQLGGRQSYMLHAYHPQWHPQYPGFQSFHVEVLNSTLPGVLLDPNTGDSSRFFLSVPACDPNGSDYWLDRYNYFTLRLTDACGRYSDTAFRVEYALPTPPPSQVPFVVVAIVLSCLTALLTLALVITCCYLKRKLKKAELSAEKQPFTISGNIDPSPTYEAIENIQQDGHVEANNNQVPAETAGLNNPAFMAVGKNEYEDLQGQTPIAPPPYSSLSVNGQHLAPHDEYLTSEGQHMVSDGKCLTSDEVSDYLRPTSDGGRPTSDGSDYYEAVQPTTCKVQSAGQLQPEKAVMADDVYVTVDGETRA